MDPLVLEARYQRAVYKGDVGVLEGDFRLRYGERWAELWAAAEGAGEEDVRRADEHSDELCRLVESRIDDRELAALYAAYGRALSLEGEVEAGLELLGRAGGLERLLRWGLVMHFSEDVVAAPPYLAKLLIKLEGEAPRPRVNLDEELGPYLRDGGLMAFVEGLLAEEFDERLHRALYGEVPRTVRLGRVALYRPEVGLVVNPVLSAGELLEELLRVKRSRADVLAKALSLHGEYEFSLDHRCGLQYISVDGTAEKSGVVAICPWASYSRKLWRRTRNMVLVLEGEPPPGVERPWFGVIYIRGGEARVLKPRELSRLFEYVVDVLYSVGFSVAEEGA